MNDTEKLKQERAEIYHDVMNNKIPKRVLIDVKIGMHAIAEYGKVDPRAAYWDYSVLEKSAMELAEIIPTDVCLAGGNFFHPAKFQALDSRAIKMSADGFMQHPNTHMLEPEDYDEFIKDPYKFIVETAVPRNNPALDFKSNPAGANAALFKAIEFDRHIGSINREIFGKISEKGGYASFPRGGGGYASFDILTDELRSFSGMLTDVKRYRSKVKAAVEAIYPFNFFHSMPDMKTYTRDAFNYYAFHMATYMNTKDFEDLWWAPFMQEAVDFAAMGVRVGCFLETDWTKYIDYLQELPTGSMLQLEYGDAKLFKEKLGKKHVLSAGFPLGYITQLNKQQCIDKTKEWLDIMMPGGQYIFSFDKLMLTLADLNIENLKAVCETVRDYGVYDNCGTSCGEKFNSSDYQSSGKEHFSSEAYLTWDKYKGKYPDTPDIARVAVENIEKAVLNFYYTMLM